MCGRPLQQVGDDSGERVAFLDDHQTAGRCIDRHPDADPTVVRPVKIEPEEREPWPQKRGKFGRQELQESIVRVRQRRPPRVEDTQHTIDHETAAYDWDMPLPRVRPMTPADVEPTAVAFEREAWGDRRLNLAFVTSHAETHPFVAEVDGEVVGSGVASVNGRVGWIGTIWVRPDWRRRGLGLELTRTTIATAEAAGCRTLVLVATDIGRPMYERLGFEVQTWYRILEAPGLDGDDPDPRLRPYRDGDLAAIAALDAAATGEDRAHLLATFASPDTTRVLDLDDGTLGGFVVRAPWGGGATIAPRIVDAEAILRGRRLATGTDRRVRAGLLADNAAGLDRLSATGWTEAWRAPRMVRGDPVGWRPEAIWGQFNHALG